MWCHRDCSGVSKKEYSVLQTKTSFDWSCRTCLLSGMPFADCSTLASSCEMIAFDGEDSMVSNDSPIESRSRLVSGSHVKIGLLNVRSLLRVSEEVFDLLLNKGYDILAICETWLDDSVRVCEVCPPGFAIIRNDRNRRGGGVAFIVSSRVRYCFCDLSCESLWIELFPGSFKRSMQLCCTYRPPSANAIF